MTVYQRQALLSGGTDISGVEDRFSGNESLYLTCLKEYLKDPTVGELNAAIVEKDWDRAFTAVHALKGLAGNMGFVPLMNATGRLVILIRRGKLGEIGGSLAEVNARHMEISDTIRRVLEKKDGAE